MSFSSAEMAAFIVRLKVGLGEFVSYEDNPYYAIFCYSLKYLSRCYSFLEAQLALLECNISIHNQNHAYLYPKVNDSAITPNSFISFHSPQIHLPNKIRQFGALRYAWYFRYKSKNAPFKEIMHRNCIFLNVPCCLSTHHQKLVDLDFRTGGEGKYFGVSDNIEVI